MLASHTGQAFSLAHAQQTTPKTSIHKAQKKQTKFTDSQFGELKVELLSDYDTDENETDHDTVDTSAASDSTDFIRNFLAILTSDTPVTNKNAEYFAVNTSRLPRHNYISLQVFRIWFDISHS